VESVTKSKQQVERVFSGRVEEWSRCYSECEAPSLDAKNLFSRQRIALEMLRAAVPPPATVLDLGCGTGETTAKLMSSGYDVWGVDIAEPMIAHAVNRQGFDRFRVGDMEQIPFPDGTFDAVVCLGVIEYLESDERALQEIRRVLKPGGSAVLSTPNAASPFHTMDAMVLRLERLVRPLYHVAKYRLRGKRAPVEPAEAVAPHRRYRRKTWLRDLRAAGFRAEDWVCHGFGWYRSRLGQVVESLSRQGKLVRDSLERRGGAAPVERALGSLVRCRAVNWIAAEQIVRLRAIKILVGLCVRPMPLVFPIFEML
jgi:ubiquinone/menaquinone biosynthesis C-methylase UbiE